MYFRRIQSTLASLAVIFLLFQVSSADATCYSNTKTFDPEEGISWNYPWSQTIPGLPSGFSGDSATIEIKVQVWGWGFYPNPARLDILCSDTNAFSAGNPDYLIGSLTPSTNPNPSNFYTRTFSLKPNQIQWLTNDKTLNFIIVSNGGTYYLDYCKLTICGSISTSYTLTVQVNGSGTTTPAVGTHTYIQGEVVNLTAVPEKGWHFINWTGDVADPKSPITTLTMNASKTVVANFKKVNLSPLILLLEND
jgi:Divergent InlB B-repeat domain